MIEGSNITSGFRDAMYGGMPETGGRDYELVDCFTYDNVVNNYVEVSNRLFGIASACLEVCTESEYRKVILSENRWVIKQTFCDSLDRPVVVFPNSTYKYGIITLARSLDFKFSEFMGGRRKAYFKLASEVADVDTPSAINDIFNSVLESVISIAGKIITPNFNYSMFRSYRSLANTNIVVVSVPLFRERFLCRSNCSDIRKWLSYISDDAYLIIEYDSKRDALIKCDFIYPDPELRAAFNKLNDIVIIR